jgi:pyruvate dehydrogenase phosphatase
MLRRAWKSILGAVVVVSPPAYIYYRYTESSKTPSFTVKVKEKGPDGKPLMVKRTFSLLSKAAVDQQINRSATFTSLPPSDGVVWKHTTAQVSSNNPIEDAHAEAIITTEATSSDPARSLLFYAVMDGHGGLHTSRLLSDVLIPAVGLELSTLASNSRTNKSSILDIFKTLIFPTPLSPADAPQDGHVERVSQAIQRAFDNVDFEIVNGPLRVFAANVAKLDKTNIPDLSQHPMAEASMLPALSGVFVYYFSTPRPRCRSSDYDLRKLRTDGVPRSIEA